MTITPQLQLAKARADLHRIVRDISPFGDDTALGLHEEVAVARIEAARGLLLIACQDLEKAAAERAGADEG
jgi:hypothetical protein